MNKSAEFREQCRARQKYLKKRRKKTEKKASVYLDLMVKEAGLVNHASKVINGVKSLTPKIKPVQGVIKPKKMVGAPNV